jgi:hypothetical protein
MVDRPGVTTSSSVVLVGKEVDGGKGGVAAVEGAFVSLLFCISDNHFFATAFLVGEKFDIQNNWVVGLCRACKKDDG